MVEVEVEIEAAIDLSEEVIAKSFSFKQPRGSIERTRLDFVAYSFLGLVG